MGFTLFLGGVRSGKTGLAQLWAARMAPKQLMVATCHADDPEMAGRIALHKKGRGPSWQLLEEPLEPAQAIGLYRSRHPDFAGCIVLDSVGMLINNLMLQNLPIPLILRRVKDLAQFFGKLDLPCAIISEECGQGLVGATAIARKYVDLLGAANQYLARAAQNAVLAVAGLPLSLKGNAFQTRGLP